MSPEAACTRTGYGRVLSPFFHGIALALQSLPSQPSRTSQVVTILIRRLAVARWFRLIQLDLMKLFPELTVKVLVLERLRREVVILVSQSISFTGTVNVYLVNTVFESLETLEYLTTSEISNFKFRFRLSLTFFKFFTSFFKFLKF